MRGVIKKASWIRVDHQVSDEMVILRGGGKVISIIFEHIQHASCWMKIRPWLFPSAGTFTSDTNTVAQWKNPWCLGETRHVWWWNPHFGDFSLNQSFDYHDLWVEITSIVESLSPILLFVSKKHTILQAIPVFRCFRCSPPNVATSRRPGQSHRGLHGDCLAGRSASHASLWAAGNCTGGDTHYQRGASELNGTGWWNGNSDGVGYHL